MKNESQKPFIKGLIKQFRHYYSLYSFILPEVEKDISNILKTSSRQEIWNLSQLQYAMDDQEKYGQLYFNNFMIEFIKAIRGTDRNTNILKLDLLKVLCIDNGYESGSDLLSYNQQKNYKHSIELKQMITEKMKFI